MTLFTKEELLQLAERQNPLSVSIFMPINRSSAEIQRDQLELKTRLKTVEDTIRSGGISASEASSLLEDAYAFSQDRTAWRDRGDGLALFVSSSAAQSTPPDFQTYWLPISVPPLTTIGPRFHVKPLMPLLYGDGKFCILALSQKTVRLLEGSRFDIREIELKNVPKSLRQANTDLPEKQKTIARPSGVGAGQSFYYSMDTKTDVIQDEIELFFRDVDHALHQTLKAEGVPVVIAAVEYLIPIYKGISTYSGVLAEGVPGNPELLSPAELHAKAWKIVQPIFEEPQREALARFQEYKDTHRASTKVLKIVNAAYHGGVDVLFVAIDRQHWGQFNPETGAMEAHQEPERTDSDILDLAAVYTLSHHGSVYTLPVTEMPDGAQAAAIFRPAYAPNL